MRKRVEMIISYITDGTDYEYHDNHGVLIRCKDCRYYHPSMKNCAWYPGDFKETDYCSRGKRDE